MSKSIKSHKSSEKEIILEALFQSAKQVSGQNPVGKFVNGLLTESEKLILGRRILIAQMILAGETRMEIQAKLDVSPNTVTQVRKWLSGQIPDYDQIVKEQKSIGATKRANKLNTRKKRAYSDPISFAGIRHKYPAHFLLFNLAEELIRRLGK